MKGPEYLDQMKRLRDHLDAALQIADRVGLNEPLRLLPARTCRDVAHDILATVLAPDTTTK